MGDQTYHDATQHGFEALKRDDLESSLTAFEEAFRLARNDRDRASAQIQIGWRLQSLDLSPLAKTLGRTTSSTFT